MEGKKSSAHIKQQTLEQEVVKVHKRQQVRGKNKITSVKTYWKGCW